MSYRILVLDDEEPILLALQDYFTTFGFKVDIAQDVDKAKSLIAKTRYAAAIVDLRLSVLDGTEGLDVIRCIRKHWASTFIIVLTAYGTPTIEQIAIDLGVNTFLHKPIPLADVMKIVVGLLGTTA